MSLTQKPLRIGGVMRCCSETLFRYQDDNGIEEEGTVLPCKWCKSSLIVKDGAWEWNQETDIEIKRDLLQESYSIACGKNLRYPDLPMMYVGSSDHVKLLVARLDAWAAWRVRLMERVADDLPQHDLLRAGPSFKKGE